MTTALEAQCASAIAAVDARRTQMEFERLMAPEIQLWDGNINLQFAVRSENGYKWVDNENDTGPGTIEIDGKDASWAVVPLRKERSLWVLRAVFAYAVCKNWRTSLKVAIMDRIVDIERQLPSRRDAQVGA